MAEPSSLTLDVGSRRRHAELVADIAASAVPHRGRLRTVREFAEERALHRPSVLRRVAADLGAAVPPDTVRLVAAGWSAAVLATAVCLHTGLPLTVLDQAAPAAPDATDTPEAPGAPGAPGFPSSPAPDTGTAVALVVASAATEAEVTAAVAAVHGTGGRVTTVLSVLATAPAAATVAEEGRPVRVAVLNLDELHGATVGGRS